MGRKFKSDLTLKSASVQIVELVKFASIIDEIHRGQKSKNKYINDPRFNVDFKDGKGEECSSAKDFESCLINEDLKKLARINFEYYGVDTYINFSYSKIYGDIQVKIITSNKANLLGYEDDIKRVFKNSNWNQFVHNPLYLFLSFLCLALFFPLATLSLMPKNYNLTLVTINDFKFELFSAINYSVAICYLFVLMPMASGIYPKLVIKATKDSGRELKKDISKIIVFIVITICAGLLLKVAGIN